MAGRCHHDLDHLADGKQGCRLRDTNDPDKARVAMQNLALHDHDKQAHVGAAAARQQHPQDHLGD